GGGGKSVCIRRLNAALLFRSRLHALELDERGPIGLMDTVATLVGGWLQVLARCFVIAAYQMPLSNEEVGPTAVTTRAASSLEHLLWRSPAEVKLEDGWNIEVQPSVVRQESLELGVCVLSGANARRVAEGRAQLVRCVGRG